MAVKTETVLWGVAAGGFLLLGGWLFYGEYEKNKHVDEYLGKVRRSEQEYKNALDRGNYAEAQRVLDFYQGLMDSEEKVINQKGWMQSLVDSLAKLGIIVFGGYISIQIINWLLKKYPPPSFKCPLDGQTFTSQSALESHMQQAHGTADTAKAPAAQGAWGKLKDWIKRLLSDVSGVPMTVLEGNWGQIPAWQLVAIACAAILILAFVVLDPFGWFSGLVTIAAMVA